MEKPVERLMVASSMSFYGEGLYQTRGARVPGCERPLDQLRAKQLGTAQPRGRDF